MSNKNYSNSTLGKETNEIPTSFRFWTGRYTFAEITAGISLLLGFISLTFISLVKLNCLSKQQGIVIKTICFFITASFFGISGVALIFNGKQHALIGYAILIAAIAFFISGCILFDKSYFDCKKNDQNNQPFFLDAYSATSSGCLFQSNTAPKFLTKYFRRKTVMENVFREISTVISNPGNDVVLITGDHGVGKTQLVSHLFDDQEWLCDNPDYVALVEEADFDGVVVLWLECQCFKKKSDESEFEYDKKKFNEELLKLATKCDPFLVLIDFKSIASFFNAKGQRALFVFDDMENADLLEYFLENQHDQSLVSCCVICRNPGKLVRRFPDKMKNPLMVDRISETGEFTQMLDFFFNDPSVWKSMRQMLSDDNFISQLEVLCGGLPIVLRLTCTALQAQESKEEIYQEMMRIEMPVHDFKNINHAVVFENSLKRLPVKFLQRYLFLLLFDVQEPAPLIDLGFVWGDHYSKEVRDNYEAFEIFERNSLAERVRFSEKSDAFQTHILFFEAALKLAGSHFNKALCQQLICCSTDNECANESTQLVVNFNITIQNIRIHLMARAGRRYINRSTIDDATATLVFLSQSVERQKHHLAFQLLEKLPRNAFRYNRKCQLHSNLSKILKQLLNGSHQAGSKGTTTMTLTHMIAACGQHHLLWLLYYYCPDRVKTESIQKLFPGGTTPLELAAAEGFNDIVEMLLEINPKAVTNPD